jgi:hypothetical protein
MKKYLAHVPAAIQYLVPPLLLWVSGFFFSMLWFMLMADTLAVKSTTEVLPAATLAAIINFYTVIFGPMTWFVKIVFALGLLTMTLQLTIKAIPWYIRWIVFITNAPPIFMAALYIIPLVDHLITNADTPEVQSQMVHTVYNAHILAASCVLLMIVLQIFINIHLRRLAEKN